MIMMTMVDETWGKILMMPDDKIFGSTNMMVEIKETDDDLETSVLRSPSPAAADAADSSVPLIHRRVSSETLCLATAFSSILKNFSLTRCFATSFCKEVGTRERCFLAHVQGREKRFFPEPSGLLLHSVCGSK